MSSSNTNYTIMTCGRNTLVSTGTSGAGHSETSGQFSGVQCMVVHFLHLQCVSMYGLVDYSAVQLSFMDPIAQCCVIIDILQSALGQHWFLPTILGGNLVFSKTA